MINKLPGPRLAFLPEADAEALAEDMVAMANSDGGLIIFGVDEDGTSGAGGLGRRGRQCFTRSRQPLSTPCSE